MVLIANGNGIDWNAIRAEYIGGMSIRELAKKYGVNKSTIGEKSASQHWADSRTKAADKARTLSVQKTAARAADNATLALDIKRRLLLRLQRAEERFPMDATEIRLNDKGKTLIYRLRDLTACYRDLTADMVTAEQQQNPLLQSLYELEKRLGHD